MAWSGSAGASVHVGPVAAGFWRLALAVPFLAWLAWRQGAAGPRRLGRWFAAVVLGGLFFAADLAAWHAAILRPSSPTPPCSAISRASCSRSTASCCSAACRGRSRRCASACRGRHASCCSAAATSCRAVHFAGDLLALLAGLFYAFYLIAVDRARRVDGAVSGARHRHRRRAPAPLLCPRAGDRRECRPDATGPRSSCSRSSSQLIGQGLLVYAMGHLSPVRGRPVLPHPADRVRGDRLERL